jgi:type II secretory pathway component PulF
MKFSFKAKNKLGKITEGVVEAVNADLAIATLQNRDLFPISVAEEAREEDLLTQFLKIWDKVDAKEQMLFFRQLAILIEARVPIVPALVAIKEQAENKYFKKILEEIVQDIDDGLPLSEAMRKYPNVFSVLSVNIIKAGEISGNLRKSVTYVSDSIEKNYLLTSKIKSAMTYPSVVLAIFFLVGFVVMTVVMPKLTQVIKDMGVDVPWYTKVVISISDFMTLYWWAVLLIIFSFVGGIIYYIRTEEGKKDWDEIKLKLPVFGLIFRLVYLARFADNLAVLLAGGIPIINALETVSSVIGNSVYERIFLEASEEVKIGGAMSKSLRKHPEIPPIVAHMVKIGEESGQIDSVLGYIAKFYEQETDQMTKNLTTLIEPVMMVIIGIAVGFLAVAIIMPIYNLAGQL